MKKIILAIILIAAPLVVSAQKLRAGFIGGYQHTFPYAMVSGDVNKITFNPRSGMGIHVGGYLGWNFRSRLWLDVQLLYSMRSYRFDMQFNNDPKRTATTIFKRQVFYAELPLHLGYSFRIDDNISILPIVGASFSAALHGKDIAYEATELQKPMTLETENKNLFDKDGRMYRFGLSPEIGVDIRYKDWAVRPLYSVSINNITRQNFGWTYTLPSAQTKYLFNHVVRLSAIYMFKIQ